MVHATLVHDGVLFAPAPRGAGSVLAVGGAIAAVGELDARDAERALSRVGIALEVLDARGLVVAPGLIDPHEHLLGSSGEKGFSSRAPEIFCTELVEAGITTVVGTLGADNSMRTLAELLAKVKALREEGLSAYMYSGGYTLPPMSVMDSLRNDLLYIDAVIGAGEIAISDRRAVQPDTRALAAAIVDTYVGGLLSGKAGITHVHVGEGSDRLAPLRRVLDEFDVEPSAIYPTHVARTPELLREAVALARRGIVVDVDTTDGALPHWIQIFAEEGGDLDRLTVSTDAGGTTPSALRAQLAACTQAGWPLERVLSLATANTARVLQLRTKGRLEPGLDADVVALRPHSLEPVHVVAGGRVLMRAGRIAIQPHFLEDSDREVTLRGAKR